MIKSLYNPTYNFHMNTKYLYLNKKKGRNSTIKQEQEQNHQNGVENQSSISIHGEQHDDVHYYDLDYSDQQENQALESSSDQNERQITHEQFMHMIQTGGRKYHQSFNDDNQEEMHKININFRRSQNKQSKSHEFRIQNNKFTPSTRDRSQNFYEYGIKNAARQSRNDPQKSSQVKHGRKSYKQISFNSQNSVRQFKIDSFLNAQIKKKQQQKPKGKELIDKRQERNVINEDTSFSLITLPQYDEESVSNLASNEQIKQQDLKSKRLKKYKDVAKLSNLQNSHDDKLNWRYQEAKLKFMDNFLPDSMKIGTSTYNMFKYIQHKNELSCNIMNII